MSSRLLHGWLVLGVLVGFTAPARGEDPGEAEFYKAIEMKLNATNLFQMEAAVEQCRKALAAGLTGGRKTFCEKMMAAALTQRGKAIGGIASRGGRVNKQLLKLALDDLEAAVKADPKASDAFLELGRLKALPGGDRKAAQADLTKAVDLEKAAGREADGEIIVEALLLRSQLTDDPKQRLADFNEAVKFGPNNADVLRQRAELLLEDGKTKEALADVDAALEADPGNAQSHELRGRALLVLDKVGEAIESFGKAIEIAKTQPMPYVHRARAYLIQGKGQKAVDDLNKVFAIVRPNAQLLLLRARAFQAVGNLARAEKDADAALELRGEEPSILLQAGLVYYAAKQNTKAAEAFTKAIEKSPKNAAAYAARADAYLKIGKHAEATADYRQSLKLESDNTHVLNNLAWVLATSTIDKVRDADQAIELARKACELTKYKEAHIVSTLAAGYAEKGDFKTAIKWSLKAVDLGQGDVKENLKKELKSYQAGKPWRERNPADE